MLKIRSAQVHLCGKQINTLDLYSIIAVIDMTAQFIETLSKLIQLTGSKRFFVLNIAEFIKHGL